MLNNNSRAKIKFITVIFLLVILSCRQETIDKSAKQLQAQSIAKDVIQKMINDFQISISIGGGFSGIYNGKTLYSDGTIEQWKQVARYGRQIENTTKVDPETINILRKELEETGALEQQIREAGNMTTKVEYMKGDSTYSWYWSDSDELSKRVPEFLEWYKKAYDCCADTTAD